MFLFLLLSILALGMTVWILKKANRGLRIQLMEEQTGALRFSQDLEQSNYERDKYRGYWNSTFDENITMSDLKKPVRQIVNRSGVPKAFWTGHWMKWWISVRCMDFIPHMAVAGT